MADNKVFNRGDDEIAITDTEVHQVDTDPTEFVLLTLQADPDNTGDVRVGGTDPKIRLLPGATKEFKNGFLNQVYTKGTIGDKVNVHIEY